MLHQSTAVVCYNDKLAINLLRFCRQQGIRVPEDIQIVGFDDISFSSLVSPALTTIHQPIAEMGRKAVDIIFRYAEGREYSEKNVFDVRLVERETTMRKK